ncbi:hypothetical protein HYT02_00180, partial [Candidatus Gottesmanbacteria bacterium]|nr:hypothetical protein [Candidatus Gottesmanbacteria bacterium]
EAIQARAIRRVGSCTVDEPPVPWEQQGYYAVGTNFSLQTALPSQNPTSSPTTQPAVSPTVQPSTTPQIPVCASNQCNACILNNRTDILPFYQQNGWDTSCGNQDAIVNNWCGIDSGACNDLKSNECASVCQTTPPISCPRGNMGNLNCDSQGCINDQDLTIFRTYFGKPGNSGNFFSDQSSIIDTADYEILRQNFGTCSTN